MSTLEGTPGDTLARCIRSEARAPFDFGTRRTLRDPAGRALIEHAYRFEHRAESDEIVWITPKAVALLRRFIDYHAGGSECIRRRAQGALRAIVGTQTFPGVHGTDECNNGSRDRRTHPTGIA